MKSGTVISPTQVINFAHYVRSSPTSKLTIVPNFYREHLRFIIAEKDVLSSIYS